ncbi:MAG: GntR family transcriptional regulator [Acidobacteria bacterium]|mgnify:CR=1 FL=1|nr:GntR family transcriptional regulator [Acidobacteriota bacterium]
MTEDGHKNLAPIEREVLSEQVKDRILTWIIEGELAPGSRIVETRVARELGTSQAPVREALRDLATLGFVDIRPYRGSRVRKPSRKEIGEAIEVRVELEAMAGKLAAVRRTENCLRDLKQLLSEMMEAADRGDSHEAAKKNTQFHARIFEATGNQTLERLWSMLEPFSLTYVISSTPGIDQQWLSGRHQLVLDVIAEGDADRAAETMRIHATEAGRIIEEFEHPELENE